MLLWRPTLDRGDKARSDPDATGAIAKRRRERATIPDASGSHNGDGLTSQRALVAASLDNVDDAGDYDREGDVTGVPTCFTALNDDHVDTELERLFSVLGVPDNVADHDVGLVQLVDYLFWWDADGGYKELGARLDDNVNELVQVPASVVVLREQGVR